MRPLVQPPTYERPRSIAISTSALLLYAALATFFATLVFVGVVWAYYD